MFLHSKIKNILNPVLTFPGTSGFLNFVDVGARDGIQFPWSNVSRDSITVTLVDADQKEAEKLMKSGKADFVLNSFLSDKAKKINFKILKSPGASSVLMPNEKLINRYPEVERFDVQKEIEVKSSRLDSILQNSDIKNIDFIKIDTQGTALSVIKGMGNHINQLCGLEVELEFSSVYKDQELYGSVVDYITKNSELRTWDIRGIRWIYCNNKLDGLPKKGRLIHADFLFLIPVENLSAWLEKIETSRRNHKLESVVFSAMSYGFYDYVFEILQDQKLSSFLQSDFIDAITREIKRHKSYLYRFKNGNSKIYFLLNSFASLFKPKYNGWSHGARSLGVQKKGPFWVND